MSISFALKTIHKANAWKLFVIANFKMVKYTQNVDNWFAEFDADGYLFSSLIFVLLYNIIRCLLQTSDLSADRNTQHTTSPRGLCLHFD